MKRTIVLLLLLLSFVSVSKATTEFFSSLEANTTSEFCSSSGTFSIQTSVVHSGKYALQINPVTTSTGSFGMCGLTSGGAYTTNPVVFSTSTWTRTYFLYTTKPASGDEEMEVILDTTGVLKGSLRLNSSGNLVFYSSATVAQSTGTTALLASTWYLIQLNVTTNTAATNGVYQVYIGQVLETSGTAKVGTANAGQPRVGKDTNRNGNSVVFYYDDMLWNNSGLPGPGQSAILLASTTGFYAGVGWTSKGGGSPLVTDINQVPPDGDTTYMTANDSGLFQSFKIQSMTVGSANINSVKVMEVSRNAGTASGCSQNVYLRVNSTDFPNATTFTNNATYFAYTAMYDTNPKTGAAWTVQDVNAVEVVADDESATGVPTQVPRVTTIAAFVDYFPLYPTILYNFILY